jgi:hypothetical protein
MFSSLFVTFYTLIKRSLSDNQDEVFAEFISSLTLSSLEKLQAWNKRKPRTKTMCTTSQVALNRDLIEKTAGTRKLFPVHLSPQTSNFFIKKMTIHSF